MRISDWSSDVCSSDLTPDLPHLIARELTLDGQGISFVVDSHLGRASIRSRLLGRFNVDNLLAALGALVSRGVSLIDAAAALEQANTVPGRIEGFRGGKAKPLEIGREHV